MDFTEIVNGKSFQREKTNEIWSFHKGTCQIKIVDGDKEETTYYDYINNDDHVFFTIDKFGNERLHFQILTFKNGYTFKVSGRDSSKPYGTFKEILK